MASFINPWIAPLIEDCLTARRKTSQVEDDGSNLRFSETSRQFALVNSWSEGNKTPTINVTDLHTQIDAVLAKESIETYRRECPNRPFNKNTIRGSYLQLLEFEVVFEYLVSQPKLHLYVKHFKVAFDKGTFKGPPQGKGMKRHATLYKLMRTTLGQVKSGEKRQNVVTDVSCFNETPQSQQNDASLLHNTQDFLASQVQPTLHPPSRPSAGSTNLEKVSVSSSKLLGLLEPNPKTATHGIATSRAIAVPPKATERAQSIETEGSRQAHSNEPQVADGNNRETNEENGRKSTLTLTSQSMAVESVSAPNAAPQSNPDEVEWSDLQPSKPDENQEHSKLNENVEGTTKSESTLVGSPGKKMPDKAVSGTERSPNDQESKNSDPWLGMTKIHRRDVTIPKNQAALFEQHALRWVPPAAGERMPQGHVPPALLRQWNDIAYERNQSFKAKEREAAESEQIEKTDVHEPSPNPSSPASESASEADSDSPYSWDGSPERDVRPRQQLPADSSPAERNPPKIFVAKANSENQSDAWPIHEKNQNTQGVQDRGEVNEASTAPEPQIVDLEDAAQARQPDSDEESEDSMMDTSVPCPLGAPGSQQTYFLSQSEAEITSSGPSLPGYNQEQVQVVETPAGNFHRLQPRDADKNKTGQVAFEQITTPQDKSSSQSRILNTYASNQFGTQNTQGSSNLSQGKEFHEVDIMATQLSNGSWQPQVNATSPRPSMAVPNSTSQSDESSKPFSSHKEMLSSIPSGENAENASDIPESAQGPPVQHAPKSPLKRFVSELDAEEPSLAKRHKITDQAKELIPGVISAGHNYIDDSSNHVEAQKIYEKFRNDYRSYEGDFMHFTELCFKLRALRAKGDLQRSFLWDDFVIQHLKDYQQHIKQSQAEDSKSQEYEAYFASNFSRPSFKKRSLTADAIEIAASQHMAAGHADASASPAAAKPQMGTSFTGSLADKFSNLQTHSFGPSTQDLQPDTDDERMSVAMSSPTPRGRTKWHTPFEDPPDRTEREDIQSSGPEAAERDQDSENVAHDAKGVGNHEAVKEAEKDRNAGPQDVEMVEVVERATSMETSEDVEIVKETDITGDTEMKGHDQRSKGVESAETADVAKEAHLTEIAADAEHAETDVAASEIDTEGSRAVEMTEAPSVSQDVQDDESTQDIEDVEDPGASENSRYTNDADNAKVAEVIETIEETNMIQETPEFENPDEYSQEADLVDETHETASIELGDSQPEATAKVSEATEEHELRGVPASDDEPEPGHGTEAKSVNENWFRSLRHLHQRPPEPIWSDDYNTPFKKWARADQNIFKERQRRGGARIPVDEKGVIQRFEH